MKGTTVTALPSYLTARQINLLMMDLHESRVLSLDGNSYLAQWDVRAMLTRVFGFGRWSDEGIETRMLFEEPTMTKGYGDKPGKPAFKVCYIARRRLTVHAPDGTPLASYEGTSVADQTMPDFKRGDCHDFAIKTAESGALKRAAMNLGTQFGLGLYGNTRSEVIRVLAMDPRTLSARDTGQPTDDAPVETVEVEVTHDEDMTRRTGEDA
jgi:recombination DNA repair RAD52 pathway protein